MRFFDFSTRAMRTVATLDESARLRWLTVSPDGRTIRYTQTDTYGSDLILVERP